MADIKISLSLQSKSLEKYKVFQSFCLRKESSDVALLIYLDLLENLTGAIGHFLFCFRVKVANHIFV